jgi:catechol 2,3-dioxygenase-like lactoylglutathione lyase family enzyme
MDVQSIRWVGIRTDQFDPMRAFLRDVLGLRTTIDEPTSTEFETTRGDRIQIMAPGDPYYAFFAENARGPVPLFEVDNVRAARSELEAAGAEVIGSVERDSGWEWIHVRAPDGNLYEFGSRHS